MMMALVACGTSESNTGGSGGSSGGGSSTANLSNIGTTPSYSSDHPGYLTGTHASFGCETCHTLPLTGRTAVEGEQASVMAVSDRTQICSSCHIGNYSATSALNHSQHGIGTYCNSCHYSDSFTSHNRAATSSYHSSITTNCESCHSGRQPASHGSDRQSGCASCHGYPSWASATGFNHSGVTSGCNASGCHSQHYSGYDCVWCHTGSNPGVSWGSWSHSRADNRACTACHADGKGDDDDGKGDDGKDDDDRTGGRLLSWLE